MNVRLVLWSVVFLLSGTSMVLTAQQRLRDLGVSPGIFDPGPFNAITDVPGVRVGHVTLIEGEDIRTGVTAILPHGGNLFQEKVPAAIHLGNGFGKLAGYSQVKELGYLETPVILTNTLAVAAGIEGVIRHTLATPGNEKVSSVNAVVGETNDGRLNHIRKLSVVSDHVLEAIRTASGGPVEEGHVGAGTGTVCFGYKGGIGTASRVLPDRFGGYAIGVLVQSNFGGILDIDGIPVGKETGIHPYTLRDGDGSCMMIIATNAPLEARNLERLAKRAMMGFARTGGTSSNGSGDYVIAFSTHEKLRYEHSAKISTHEMTVLRNDALSPLFQAAIEATEEAIINSLLMAKTMTGYRGFTAESLDVERLTALLRKFGRID